MGTLIAAECQPDGTNAIVVNRPQRRSSPTAADVQQPHPWLQAALAQREVNLGPLRLGQRHVVSFEVGATVGQTRIEEQLVKLVRTVVVGLHILVKRAQCGPRLHCWIARRRRIFRAARQLGVEQFGQLRHAIAGQHGDVVAGSFADHQTVAHHRSPAKIVAQVVVEFPEPLARPV